MANHSAADFLPRQSPVVYAAVYASIGWRVFPLYPDTLKPAIKRWQHLATTSRDQIAEWWWFRPACAVGIATGERSGIWVLDIDVKDGINGFTSLRKLCAEHDVTQMPDTFRVRTRSGGEHCYFEYPPDPRIRNSVKKLAPNLDTKSDGGFVVAPGVWPGGTYRVLSDRVVTRAWRWLEERLERPEYAPLVLPPGDTLGYARATLEHLAADLAATPPGNGRTGRNDALNTAAFQLGQLGALGVLSQRDAYDALMQACKTNGLRRDDGDEQCRKSFMSGWAAGGAVRE